MIIAPKRGGVCASDDYFKAITHFAPGAILLITHDGYVKNINPMGCWLFEVTREEAVGKHLLEVWDGRIIEEVDLLLRNFKEGQRKPVLIDLTTREGKQKTLSVEMFPCQEYCSDNQCMVAFFSNVTSLQRSEEALRRVLSDRLRSSSIIVANSDLKYQGVVEASPNWVSLIDLDGKLLVINDAGRRILGREEKDILGVRIWDLFPDPESKKLKTGILQSIQSCAPHQQELLMIVNDSVVHVSLVCKPISDSNSLITRLILIVTDITARKNAELNLKHTLDTLEERVIERTKQLEAANNELAKEIAARKEFELRLKKSMEEAESANLAKSEFLANMSHEIRTPMNSVLGFIDLLLSTTLTEKQTDYALTVKSSGSLLLALIDDILDLSKIEANKLILEKMPFSFGRMVREIIKLFEPKAAEKGIMLSLELDSFLLENEVMGDGQRVRQVMINLIGNAVKFTREGYVKIRANNSRNDSNTFFIDVTVEDSGIGISPDDLPKVFEKFTQANTGTTRKFGGTGLGLAISKRLVDLMGGTLGCCSTPGKGSEFFFHIPFDVPPGSSNSESSAKGKNERIPVSEIVPAAISILIVEDDPASRKFAEQCLDNFGFIHTSVDNGLHATETLNRTKFDLVIMDWCLPGWSGLSIAEQLRNNQGPNQHVPIIAVTARAMKGDRETCLKAGMNSYLSKPFSPEDLYRQIIKLLKLRNPS